MIHRRIAAIGAIGAKVKKIKDRAAGKNRAHKSGLAALAGIFFFAIVALALIPLPDNHETALRRRPKNYSVSPAVCDCQKNSQNRIEFSFWPSELSLDHVPEYTLTEFPEAARTVVVFRNVSSVKGEFNYGEVIDSDLIDSIDYDLAGENFVVEINRKGSYLPAAVLAQGSRAVIVLETGDKNSPEIFNQTPADNSAAFPATRVIGFSARLNAPLKNAAARFQNAAVAINAIRTAPDEYFFSFSETLENDREYFVKAIVTDAAGRTTVSAWTFTAQIPSQAALGRDRFKYLGWWGQINANGVSVRANASSTAERLGAMSSSNRVKVLKEVFGGWVDGKNLWYQIDGGMYPGAYIFSDYVTPMAQPMPPAEFTIPENVNAGDSWIDVDLTKKVLTLFKYDKPVFATYISPGRDKNPTEKGTFSVWYKLRKAEMQGGPPLHDYRYDLKNIPWVMYYNRDYAIHGTYWHDKFGMPQSAGCTNMTQGDAEYIWQNSLPVLTKDQQGVFSKAGNPGTVVRNHD